MEEQFWIMQQQSRSLQAFRQDVASLWSDEAARALNVQYLDPHQECDTDMLEAFSHQLDHLEACTHRVAEARDHQVKADEASARATREVDRCDSHTQRSEQHLQEYQTLAAFARSDAAHARALLESIQ
jgi:hypothetical protein